MDDSIIEDPHFDIEPEWARGVTIYAGLRSSIESLPDEQGLRASLLHYFPTAIQFDVGGGSIDFYLMNGMSKARLFPPNQHMGGRLSRMMITATCHRYLLI